jgi:hypothetical protein
VPIDALRDLALVLGHSGDARSAFVWHIGHCRRYRALDPLHREIEGKGG